MKLLVIDAQGGGLGREIISGIRERIPKLNICAVGTNTAATKAMLRAGADTAATGENPVIVKAKDADIIAGPVGIVIADSLNGEITPKMARSVGKSPATRVLIPYNSCNNIIVGTDQMNLAKLIEDAIDKIVQIWQEKKQ